MRVREREKLEVRPNIKMDVKGTLCEEVAGPYEHSAKYLLSAINTPHLHSGDAGFESRLF
jgi:hypothetical protein